MNDATKIYVVMDFDWENHEVKYLSFDKADAIKKAKNLPHSMPARQVLEFPIGQEFDYSDSPTVWSKEYKRA